MNGKKEAIVGDQGNDIKIDNIDQGNDIKIDIDIDSDGDPCEGTVVQNDWLKRCIQHNGYFQPLSSRGLYTL